MNNQNLVFAPLKEHHVDEATAVVTRSFMQLNDIWKAKPAKYEEIFPLLRGKILPAIYQSWSFVMMKDGKIIGVSIQYDLLQYLKLPSMPTDLQLFRDIGETGKNLDKKLDYTQFQQGEVSYGLYGVIDPDYAGKNYPFKFWWYQFALGKVAGWKYFYSRVSSPISLRLLQRLGAKILADVDVVGSQGKHKMWMICIDLQKQIPSYSEMVKILTKKKEEAKL